MFQAKIQAVVILFLLGNATTGSAQNHWKELPRATTQLLMKVSFVDSLCGWVAGSRGTMLKTTDGGHSWELQDPSVESDIHEIFALNDQSVWGLSYDQFVDTNTWYGTRVLRTTNGGVTWSNEPFSAGEFFTTILFRDSLHGLMAGEYGKILRTSNGGQSWIAAEVDSSIYAHWGVIRVKFFTPNLGFAMGGRIDIVGTVWMTTDGGHRWVADGPSPEPVHDMHMIDSLNIVAIAGDIDFGASMLRSTNGGRDWVWTFLEIFGEPQSMSFRTASEAWVPLGFVAQLMYTKDTANTWVTFNTPGRHAIYDLVFTDSLTGYAVGDSGTILKYSHPASVSVESPMDTRVRRFSLRQNYPNPFNPSTTISYSVPVESFVTLQVVNLLGQNIRTLVSQQKEAGDHRASFDGNNLPSGVYLYKLTAGEFVEVRKMVLIR